MADIIKHKRSGDTGEVPTTGELVLGELALNYYDGRLFIETYDGTTYGIAQFQPMADGDKGDITVSAKGQTWTIDNDAVTYAKIQNVSATDRLLGRSTAGAGDIEEISCTAAGRAILDDADAAAQRTTLGLGTIATQDASSVAITGGTINGATVGATTAASGRFTTVTGTDTTASTSSTTGALIVAGGAGIAKDSYINGLLVGIGGTGAGISTTNTAVGAGALSGNTNTSCTGVGVDALKNNTRLNCTALGHSAGLSNTGQGIVALGVDAARSNSANAVMAIGGSACFSNTGSSATAIGLDALYSNDGNFCVAIGYAALGYATGGNSGANNTAVGYQAGNVNGSGTGNTYIGQNAGLLVSTGSNNTFIGRTAGDVCTTGTQNTIVGSLSDLSANSNTNSTVVGYNITGDGSNTTVIGNTSVTQTKLNGTATSVAIMQGDRVRIVNAKTPASSTDTGTAGDICWDTSYLYVCTATNTWKRIALAW